MTTGSVSNKNPSYDDRACDWAIMRDCVEGERAVKEGTETYLPKPGGFSAMPDQGAKAYASYMKRAQFPEIVGPTIGGMVGVIHRVEASVSLPESMFGLFESATDDGLPLEALHARITSELLTTGRYSLLVGAASEGSELPYLVGYSAEALINWDTDFYVLDESGWVRNGFDWTEEKQFRVLEKGESGYYQQRLFEGDNLTEGDVIEPQARGGKRMTEIPFVVMNARDVSLETEPPPLMGVARSAIAMYQLSADYRWQLFNSGQETLFIYNADAPAIVGAGVIVALKADGEQEPKAEYVGPEGTGIEAHKIAINDERQNAVNAGAKMFDTQSAAQESGDAKRIRYAAQTATLVTIAQTSAKGLEKALRYVGQMMGLSEAQIAEIVVKPNLSFIETRLTSQEVTALVDGWQNGAYSYETLYENLQRGEIASAERTAEEELDLIDREQTGREDDASAVTPAANPEPEPEPDNGDA